MSTALDNLVSLARLPASKIPAPARTMASFSLFDWIVVGRAGQKEPVSTIITNFLRSEGGQEAATLFGGLRVPARAAALGNGTISHALDYDDTHFAHIGHLSVGILPAALAVAEETNASGAEVRDAFLLGAEGAVRLGVHLGRGHYQHGFHQTATAGAFGATIAAARLLKLSDDQTRHALSLVSTRASGLKSQFGTMGKPYNAGIAAANGVEAAKLASLGFVSCDDGVFGTQGFVETHSEVHDPVGVLLELPLKTFLFEDVKYKLHACCHGTHAMIDAMRSALEACPVEPGEIASVTLRTNPRWLRVCDKKTPRTGLEVKFSYVWLAGMVVGGFDTSADATFTDALCSDPKLAEFATRVIVSGAPDVPDTAAIGAIEMMDGRIIEFSHDLAARRENSRIETGLYTKAKSLIGVSAAKTLWSTIGDLDNISAQQLAKLLC